MDEEIDSTQSKRPELNRVGKIQVIGNARHSPRDTELDLDQLVRQLHTTVENLHDDVRQQRLVPLQILRHSTDRRQKIALEIDAIAREINPTTPEREIKAETLKTFLEASDTTPDGQATDRYFYQVAYFSMTRILLVRVWEDIGFIDQTLYDGSLKQRYEHYNQQIQSILRQVFHFAGERYSWLYGVENNYTWYTPSVNVLTDVLSELSRYDFRCLDADVLGAVYEANLEKIDRKNKGQYYTPSPVVQFIWDRVGFSYLEDIFRFEGGEMRPRICLDFCTGSGGFLVEAARRIREAALGPNFDHEDSASLKNVSMDKLLVAMKAIMEGLRGSEINSFSYYLTEVNLLIQLTPIIAAIHRKEPHALNFGRDYALAVIHQDALTLHNRAQHTFEGEEYKQQLYEQDRRRDIVNLEGYKREVYRWLKNDLDEEHKADYVCSNPPYIGEKGHKDLFRFVRENLPYWKEHYQGKMDYLYWFIILGLSKLREGGRLSYITTSYWPTAEGASKLRQYILKHSKIIEMIDFGDTGIFSDAPGQHNLIFTLEKCSDTATRESNRPLLVNVKHSLTPTSTPPLTPASTPPLTPTRGVTTFIERLTALLNHIQEHINIAPGESFEDDYIKVFWSPLTQKSLSDKAWAIHYGDSDGTVIQKLEAAGVALAVVLEINAGVHSNADTVKKADLALFTQIQQLSSHVKVGQGIFVLTQQERDSLQLSPAEQVHLKPTYKTSAISQYLVSAAEELYLLYIDNAFNPNQNPTIMKHLQRFAPILKARLERYHENYPWYRLHRPHKREHYESEKLVAPRWGRHIDFAYEAGGRYENSDINIFVKSKGVPEDLKYFLALLNSRPLVFWMSHKGEFKGVSRQALLHDIPIRRIRFDGATHEGAINQAPTLLDSLKAFLKTNDYAAAYTLLHQSLSAKQEDVVHDGLVLLVEQIMERKRISQHVQQTDKLQALVDQVVLDLYGIVNADERELILTGFHVTYEFS
jgi:hypothetical protein